MTKQQDLLRDAQVTLGLTRDQLAERLGVSRRGLDKWLLPDASADHRTMPETARRLLVMLSNREPDALLKQ